MIYTEFLVIVAIALLISAVFVFIFKAPGPWGSFWTFFLILLLGLLAGALWIRPVGLKGSNVAWLVLLVVGTMIALVMSVVNTQSTRKNKRNAISGKIVYDDPDPTAKVSAIFWVLLVLLLAAIFTGVVV